VLTSCLPVDNVEESVIAKSTGRQDEEDFAPQDEALFRRLVTGKKMTKEEASYRILDEIPPDDQSCDKCKFNLPAEKKCHIVEGEIDIERGISKFFSPKGSGMLPGDIVWDFVKKIVKNFVTKKGM
jgi:hypothetical protein